MLPVLAAVLWEHDGSSDELEFREQLKRWYWAAVFSKDYGGSSDTVMGSDFRDWKEWFAHGKTMEQIAKVDAEFIEELDFKEIDKGSGRYNGVICLVALNGPRDFYRGNILGTVDFTDQRINDHHIFPKKVEGIDPEKMQTFDSYRDSIANRTLTLKDINNKIRKKDHLRISRIWSRITVWMKSRNCCESISSRNKLSNSSPKTTLMTL